MLGEGAYVIVHTCISKFRRRNEQTTHRPIIRELTFLFSPRLLSASEVLVTVYVSLMGGVCCF